MKVVYQWGRKGRQAAPQENGRSRWSQTPEHERMRRKPQYQPDTWSGRCHQREWQTPGSPVLPPYSEHKRKEEKVEQAFVSLEGLS